MFSFMTKIRSSVRRESGILYAMSGMYSVMPYPGVHKYQTTKFCTAAPKLFSTIIAVFFA